MKDQFGLNQSLAMVGLAKNTWYYQEKQKVDLEIKYSQVIEDLKTVIRANPAYGYKRAAPELKENYGHQVNKKVVLKLMRNQSLQLLRKARKPKPSLITQSLLRLGDKMNLVALKQVKGEAIGLFEVVCTDFTELIYYQGQRKAQLMPIIEHETKIGLGWALGKTPNTRVALEAWTMAAKKIEQLGFSTKGLIAHHDRDPVYTGYEWLGQILLVNQGLVSYALRGAKDNPAMESFNGRFKEENRDLFWECQTLAELKEVVREQMVYYNTKRRHSSLRNLAPLTFLKKRQKQHRF
jgi:putative transposase